MPSRGARPATLLAVALLLGAAWHPRAARAATEEFATFDVESQEEDDESALDHLLTEQPWQWRDEWDSAARAFRTSEGCLTSGQWFLRHELRVATDLGDRARFGIHLDQNEDDVDAYQYLDLSAHFPTRYGTPGLMFRPLHDKSRQDFALMWEWGADTLASFARVTWGFEDLFNNLWAFRQTRVGNLSEPYDRHPWEPALAGHLRRERWRAALEGRYLTPSRKREYGLGNTPFAATLWGAWGRGSAEARVGATALGLAFENRQATSSQQLLDGTGPDARHFRRQWSGELTARTVWNARLSTQLRARYAARDADYHPPVGNGTFSALDRVAQAEAVWSLTPAWLVRVGGMYDRVSHAHTAGPRYPSEERKKESRAYVGLLARFGRVRVAGVEGIELDREPYDVWFHHDKGFLQLQTTF